MTRDGWGSEGETWGANKPGGGASQEWGAATPPTIEETSTGVPNTQGEYAGIAPTEGAFSGVPTAQTPPAQISTTQTPTAQAEFAGTPPTKRRSLAPLVAALVAVVVLAVAGWVVLGMRGGDEATDEAAGVAGSSVASGDSRTAESADPSSDGSTSATADPSGDSTPAVTDRCTLDAVHRDPSLRSMDRILECEGEWMVAGKDRTDDVRLLRWDGNRWAQTPKTGTSRTSGFDCYRRDDLDLAGVPTSVRSRISVCRLGDEMSSVTQYSNSVACDGRYIVIVESILVRPGENADSKVRAALARNPGAGAMNPGLCPSLVGEYNGASVFPIYYDYGFSRSAACDAAKRSKGKAAVLNTRSDTLSPC